MKPLYGVMLFLMVMLVFVTPIKSEGLVVDTGVASSDANLKDNYPANTDSMEPSGRESKSAIILLLSIGLVGLAGVGKKRFGIKNHEEDSTS